MKGLSIISLSDEQIKFLIDMLERMSRNDTDENRIAAGVLDKLHAVTLSSDD